MAHTEQLAIIKIYWSKVELEKGTYACCTRSSVELKTTCHFAMFYASFLQASAI